MHKKLNIINLFIIVDYYQFLTQYNQYPLLDSWHFSAPKKSTEKDYYIPITSAVKYVFNI